MLFNSTLYLLFLPAVVVLYYQLGQRQRQALLLLASYAFYWVWSIKWSVLLGVSTVVDYFVAIAIERAPTRWKKRAILFISIAANLGLLGFFKYTNFLSNAAFDLVGARPWPILDIVLPMGISFYTFMTMSYTIDVYRGHCRARRSLLEMAVFVSYFPHLVAGPILRAPDLLPQLEAKQPFNWANIRIGVGLILWGMTKKVFVADPMARIVQEVYGAPEAASGFGLLMGTYAFAAQIYCDFSGYSDIAIGSSRLLGIKLPENFRHPYLATSITDFWRRWHISLSTWLRDYLYIPLGGNKKGVARTYVNLLITMILGGLWHGPGWHWIVWGTLHGAVLAIERAIGVRGRSAGAASRLLTWFITFHIVCASWVLFRAQNLGQAVTVFKRIAAWSDGEYYSGWAPVTVLALVLLSGRLGLRERWVQMADAHPVALRWLSYAAVAVLVITFAGASNPEFIYFQF
ncbi:MAG: MBOAT family protein [Phycisphaerales bacterium]|nr:MBOAT family protein [Phycisphaerales bacterium]